MGPFQTLLDKKSQKYNEKILLKLKNIILLTLLNIFDKLLISLIRHNLSMSFV